MSTLNFRDPSKDRQELLLGHGVTTANDIALKPVFLMCAPTYYDPRKETRSQVNGYVENDMCEQSDDQHFDPDLAKYQHAQLREAILDLGGSIILNPGESGMLDNVFKADPSLTIATPRLDAEGNVAHMHLKTIGSKFYHHARDPEVTQQMADIQFFRNMLIERFKVGVSTVELHADLHGEGTGDNVYDPNRDIFWSGYKPKTDRFSPESGRSDPDFHKLIETRFDMAGRTQPLEVNGEFFHIDTCLAPLPGGEILCFQHGMTKEGFEKLQKHTSQDDLICVDKEDARNYACNLIIMDDKHLIMSKTSPELKDSIESRGYHVTQIDLDQFIHLGGGGAHCLVNRVNQMRSSSDFDNDNVSPA